MRDRDESKEEGGREQVTQPPQRPQAMTKGNGRLRSFVRLRYLWQVCAQKRKEKPPLLLCLFFILLQSLVLVQ